MKEQQVTWEIFEKYNDKKWSYADCSLLAISRRLMLRRIFTFDRQFQQMGLDVLP